MLLLTGTTDVIRIVTSSTAAIDVHTSYADLAGSVVTPGRQNTAITTAATTTVTAAPGASTYRTVKKLNARNKSTTVSNDLTLQFFDGTTAYEIIKVTLLAGETLDYDEGNGFSLKDTSGRTKTSSSSSVGGIMTLTLTADVANANATANTMADITGLTFPVLSGQSYWFRACVTFTSAATSTGARFAVNGPTASHLAYTSRYPLTATTETFNYSTAYDQPAAAAATALTTGNVAIVEGTVTVSADGTLAIRFASEITVSAITAKAGSILQYARTA